MSFLRRNTSVQVYGSYTKVLIPYKAVLKSILLESYSWDYPNGKLLAMEFSVIYMQAKCVLWLGLILFDVRACDTLPD